MLKYSKTSTYILSQTDEKLRFIFNKAIELGIIDISIIESIRPKGKQDYYYKIGKSRVKWPNSKHNVFDPHDKSKAIDAAPCINGKISWKVEDCMLLVGIILTLGKIYGINIRSGSNWDMDGEFLFDQDFQDLAHFELVD